MLLACQQGLVTGCKPISQVQDKMKFILFMITAFGGLCDLREYMKRESENPHFFDNQIAQKETQVENYVNHFISYKHINFNDFIKIMINLIVDVKSKDDQFKPSARFFSSLSEVSTAIIPAFAILELVYIAGNAY
jgi:hypothetical protein